MNWLEHSHQIVSALILGTWIAGLVLLVLGKKGRDLDWVSFSVLAIFSIGIAVDLFFVDGSLGAGQKIWSRGWIGPRMENGAITIGMIEDSMGLTACLCAGVLGALFSANRWLIRREPDPERALAGLLMSVAGVAVAWLSLTPWLAILGLSLTTLGGVVLFGANPEPDLIGRFASERACGFVLAFLGAAVLAGGRHAITLDQAFVLGTGSLPRVFDWVGGFLLLTGLYLHLHPFPILGWLSKPARVSTSASVVVGQILPALACFGLLIRFEPELRALGVFGVYGWIAVGSTLLAAICGLAQQDWKTALPLWIASSLSFAFAGLCFSGAHAALSLLLAVSLAGAALSLSASLTAGTGPKMNPRALKSLVFVSVASGMGFVGFVGSGGLVRLMSQGAEDPIVASLLCLAMISSNLLLWKTAFAVLAANATPPARPPEKKGENGRADGSPWFHFFPGWAFVVLSLGLIWTGTFSGGALPGDPDRIFSSWMSEILGARASWSAGFAETSPAGLAQGLYWAGILLPLPLTFWLFGRKQDLMIKSLASSPRLRGFLDSGYAVDKLAMAVGRTLQRTGGFFENWISEKISKEWVPEWTARAVRTPARWINEADAGAYVREEYLIRRWTEVPAKALQLIQNGDVQWYLFFAIGSIVAILIHFLGIFSRH